MRRILSSMVMLLLTDSAHAGFFLDSLAGLKISPKADVSYAQRAMKFESYGFEGGVRGGYRGAGVSVGLALSFSYNLINSSYEGGTPASDRMSSEAVGLGVIVGTDAKGPWNLWLGYYPLAGQTYKGNNIRHLAPEDQVSGSAAELGMSYRATAKLAVNVIGRGYQFKKLKTQNSEDRLDITYSPVELLLALSYPLELDGKMR